MVPWKPQKLENTFGALVRILFSLHGPGMKEVEANQLS